MTKKHLPQVATLRYRTKKPAKRPCLRELEAMLGCWASYAEGAIECAEMERLLNECTLMPKMRKLTQPSRGRDANRLLPLVNPKPHD